ncbi:RNA polymerase sigma factor [Actinomarinicola tropica]|uniref:RNA polymerase sigma factor n=1 Tax=Actinomarinicola tropica TaxID=2789776 RepID=UPI001E2BB277|nr:sigma-70 family RNA polymerase sigma factor [Actinomarinicola tropica]
MSDDLTALVAAASRGDETAWSSLVDRYAGLVWHVVRTFRLPDAVVEDAYQTTWLRLAEHLDRIRQPESLAGWLARTARNECLRAVRLAQREHLDDEVDPPAVEEPFGQPLEDAERDAALWDAFNTLPARCQRLLRLLLADPPIPYDTISELMDMPIGSIGPTRARCLQKLRATAGIRSLQEDR